MIESADLDRPVTLDVPGAWHYGLTGHITAQSWDGEIVTVTFSGKGSVHVPAGVVIVLRND